MKFFAIMAASLLSASLVLPTVSQAQTVVTAEHALASPTVGGA